MKMNNISVELEQGIANAKGIKEKQRVAVESAGKGENSNGKKEKENGVTVQISEEAREKYNEAMNAIQMLKDTGEQNEKAREMTEDIAKIMLIFRRIANGDIVPPKDEKKLMEYNSELYQAAKNIASLKENEEPKKYKSVDREDEERKRMEELSGEMQLTDSPMEEMSSEDVTITDAAE